MKKYLIPLIIVVLSILILKAYVFVEQDKCLDSGGAWYKNLCIKSDSPEEELKKIGLIEEFKTDKIDIRITYNYKILEYPEIYQKLKNRVIKIKKETGFDDPQTDVETVSYPWSLNIDMNNFTRAGDLASILGYVFSFTGGAHPNHMFFTVNFNTDTQEVLRLQDLFENYEPALDAISAYAVDDIIRQKKDKKVDDNMDMKWVMEGAGPKGKNYSVFTFVPENHQQIKAVKFIFPPYSVGPYYEGTYEVEVPSAVFYDHLTDRYKLNFIK